MAKKKPFPIIRGEKIMKDLNKLYDIMKDIATLEEAKALIKRMPELYVIELSDGGIGHTVADFEDGSVDPKDIEWFRVEAFGKNLEFIYFYRKEGKIDSVMFDVHCYDRKLDYDWKYSDSEMVPADVFPLTQENWNTRDYDEAL